MDKNLSDEVVRWQRKLFTRSIRRQVKLEKIKQVLGSVSNRSCLEICAGDGVISEKLRSEGGSWMTVAATVEGQVALNYFLKKDVPVLQDELIDLPDQSVDVVVLVDVLERMRDDRAFVKECHRVLKSDGRLILSVSRKTFFGQASGCLHLLLGLSWRRQGFARSGYTPREFFDVLKDGFDVPETESYSTGFVENPGLLCEAFANKLTHGPYSQPHANAGAEDFYRYTRLYVLGSMAFPLMWIFSKMEAISLVVLPGHHMVAKTRRRVWRERRTPILIDGRSIAEAAINTKIGTAAPF